MRCMGECMHPCNYIFVCSCTLAILHDHNVIYHLCFEIWVFKVVVAKQLPANYTYESSLLPIIEVLRQKMPVVRACKSECI